MKKIFLLLSLLSQLSFGLTANQVWRVPNGGTQAAWGAVNLASSAAVTGVAGAINGGSGIASPTSGCVLSGAGSSAFNCDSELFWSHSGKTLSLGNSSATNGQLNIYLATAPNIRFQNSSSGLGASKGYLLGYGSNNVDFYHTNYQNGTTFWYAGVAGSTLQMSVTNVGDLTIGRDVTVTRNMVIGSSATISSPATNQLTLNQTRVYPGSFSSQAYITGAFGSGSTLNVGTNQSSVSYPIVVSATPSTEGLLIIRGQANGSCVKSAGEGFTTSVPVAGTCRLTWSNAFNSAPIVVATPIATSCTPYVSTQTTAQSDVIQTCGFNFIAIGERGQ